jgi:glycerol-3-phosphate dehydrogenase (NAD(P)+)
MVATCMSPFSRNRRVGEELGKGRKLQDILADLHMVAEGVNTASTVMRLAGRYDVEMPICREVSRVIAGEITALDAYRGLHIRAGHESEPG